MNELLLSPDDIHNRALVDRVHPTDWQNPKPADRYHLVVVGAGTAGLVAAAGAAGLGARVALVERHLMGGDCLNYGCVPSKSLIRSARAAAAVRHLQQYGGGEAGPWQIDFGAVMERMRKVRAQMSVHDSAARFRDLGVDVFLGEGRFTDHDKLEVDGQTLRFSRAVIATGARAAVPPIPGIEAVDYVTNETLFSLTELPQRLGIIGAGPIGCEMAQTFARLGSRVYLVEAAHGVLPREDPDASRVIASALERDGVQLLCCGRDIRLRKVGNQTHITLNSHDTPADVAVDALLLAVGRTPNVESLNLEAAGVIYDPGKGVHVDNRLRTSNPRVFAAGDVCSRFKFTHAADFMARLVIRNALFMGRAKASDLVIPWCTYTSPEVAHVGPTHSEMEAKGIAVDTYVQPLEQVDRAVLDGATSGFVKVFVRKGSDRIVAATIVAPCAGELIGEFTAAITHGLGLKRIANTIHPYPTLGEGVRKTGDLYNRSRLTPLVQTLFRHWLAWKHG